MREVPAPSLFNYATLLFTQALSTKFCQPITPPPEGGPLFTVEPQLPVLGVLPRLIVPMQSLVLNITKLLQNNGTAIGQHVSLVPAPVSADVPDNPAVENDQLKVFFDLKVQ
jgi:hypothetical protein